MRLSCLTVIFIFFLTASGYADISINRLALNTHLYLSNNSSTADINYPNANINATNTHLTLNFIYTASDSIYFEASPFVNTHNSNVKFNFQTANINYKTDNLSIKIGRMDYAPRNKNEIIYYGNYANTAYVMPSALDGLHHSLQLGLFYYDLIFAREAPSMFNGETRGDIMGVEFGLGKQTQRNFNVFAYHRTADDINNTILGAALDIDISNTATAGFALALNHTAKYIPKYIYSVRNNSKGYLLNLYYSNVRDGNYLKTMLDIRVILSSVNNDVRPSFTPISSKAYYGFIFSGNATDANNVDIGNISAAGFKIYNVKLDYSLQSFKNLAIIFDLYSYQKLPTKNTHAYTAFEADIILKYTRPNYQLGLIYGYYYTDEAFGRYVLQGSSINIKKVGAFASIYF